MSTSRCRRHEQGVALLVAVLLMLMMSLIGFAALDTVTKDRQVSGFLKRKKLALYAAEAGVTEALRTLALEEEPRVTPTPLGDATMHPYGQPSYRLDPTAADPLDNFGVGPVPGMDMRIVKGGAPLYQISYWRINVQGDGPGGSVARIEVASGALHSN